MSLWPSEAAARAFVDARALSTWVGIDDEAFDAVETLLGSFNGRIRNLGMLPASVLVTAITNAQVAVDANNNRQLTPVETTQMGLCWRIAKRLAADTWAGFVDTDPFAPPPAAIAVPPPLAAVPPVAPVVIAAKVKFNTVLDQHDETEAPMATETSIVQWSRNWTTFAQGPPLDEEDPTVEQLSALSHRVTVLGGSPYADFSVFTPYNRRVARANKFLAHIPQPDGSWLAKEIPGPQNFEAWGFCWRVFRCAAIQIDVLRETALSRYHQNMQTLVQEWPECWSIIYLADDKARAEMMPRRKRQLEAAAAAVGGAIPPLWDAAAPWSATMMSIAEDRDFWDKNVRNLAISWMARGRSGPLKTREQFITEYAVTGGHQAMSTLNRNTEPPPGAVITGHGSPGAYGAGTSRTAIQKRKLREQSHAGGRGSHPYSPPPKGKGKNGKDKSKGRGGGGKGKGGDKGTRHLVTAQGKQICFSWNSGNGSCGNIRPGPPCPNDRAHVCQICLSAEHASKDHPSRG